jgi:hypothetical protein
MAAGASGSTTILAEKLAAARVTLAALDDADAKKNIMHTFLADVDQRLQCGGGPVPSLPEWRDKFVGRSETDQRRPARTAAFDAMRELLAAWPRLTNADMQIRKKQKQRHQHAAELADVPMIETVVTGASGALARSRGASALYTRTRPPFSAHVWQSVVRARDQYVSLRCVLCPSAVSCVGARATLAFT